jgi:flagellar biogenesis protein FliO
MGWSEKLRIRSPWGRAGGAQRLEALERLVLGPQHSLHVVRFGEEEILVGRSPSGLAVLARAPRPLGSREEAS